jgi:hypothetical protein
MANILPKNVLLGLAATIPQTQPTRIPVVYLETKSLFGTVYLIWCISFMAIWHLLNAVLK